MRGGKRKGAGRKPRSEQKIALTVRLEPKTYDKFTKLRNAHGLSQSGLVEEMVKRG